MHTDDIVAITNTINLYATAVDTHSWDLLDRVFTPDISIDFGGPAAFEGIDLLKTAFAAIHEPFKTTQHFTSNHQVAVSGDTATAISYVRGVFIRPMPDGGDMFESTGWYDDALVRTGDGWRIAKRTSRMTWWGGNPDVLRTSPEAGPPEETDSLCAEAKAGRLAHLQALTGS